MLSNHTSPRLRLVTQDLVLHELPTVLLQSPQNNKANVHNVEISCSEICTVHKLHLLLVPVLSPRTHPGIRHAGALFPMTRYFGFAASRCSSLGKVLEIGPRLTYAACGQL